MQIKVTYVRNGLTITITIWKPSWRLGGEMILRYACGSVDTGWISLSGEIKGDDPEEKGYSGRPYWEFCVGQHPVKKSVNKNSKMSRKGLINRKRCGYRKREFIFGTQEALTLFKAGTLISLLTELKRYKKTGNKIGERCVERCIRDLCM